MRILFVGVVGWSGLCAHTGLIAGWGFRARSFFRPAGAWFFVGAEFRWLAPTGYFLAEPPAQWRGRKAPMILADPYRTEPPARLFLVLLENGQFVAKTLFPEACVGNRTPDATSGHPDVASGHPPEAPGHPSEAPGHPSEAPGHPYVTSGCPPRQPDIPTWRQNILLKRRDIPLRRPDVPRGNRTSRRGVRICRQRRNDTIFLN